MSNNDVKQLELRVSSLDCDYEAAAIESGLKDTNSIIN